MLPGRSTIGGTVNAVSPLRRIAIGRFAGADPHDIGITRRDRDCTDRLHRLFVEDRIETYAVVTRLKQTAGRKPDKKDRRIARIERDVRNPTAHGGWPNRSRLKILEQDFG